ncbi:MarR family transcriptional regulator [Pseudoalteromonas sp. McH1-7]|uniref:MarR family winged helix-turn-helix transcriptional regulator n=1 Tax=unclassified Pseudoalteromonas TaxID=194690 RepID=UPI000F649D04|nr:MULTISPECIES: MarR family transcriptional regulator [unclassified Pseudoalteromonas]NUZ12671.1 MarR family transcriptional regulator [Pseudoalteromonas sp. McH1-7]RRS06836.1 MarR family transcriptional regulator [Pseudoalteromonas sp. J010]RXF05377.1 MarR family transcriptional regulator [Pseudoalteromonas sp. PS5]USD29902.1 MarR family transcriptional regulator [Pseudoalteromonas sp. SCSIO 43201]
MDAIDRVQEQWAREKPHLETTPMAIMGRLVRIAKHMEAEVEKLHKRYGLNLGEFDVLATLRRSGEPFRLTPSELFKTMLLTSGAMTNRLDKLAAKGLIKREHCKEDRRSVTVELTAEGLSLIEKLIEPHIALQAQLVQELEPEQRVLLNELLKGWLKQFE